MELDSLLQLRLSQNPLFAGLPEALRSDVAAHAEVQEFVRSDVIGAELESANDFILILDGGVEICRNSENGTRTIYRTLHPPAGIGYSFLSGEPHSADLVAADTVRVALIPVAYLRQLLSARPELLAKAISRLAELVDTLSTELLEQRTLPVLERVRRAVYRNADRHGELHLSHSELAEYVGATRANVTRALNTLAESGEVTLGRRAIQVRRYSADGSSSR